MLTKIISGGQTGADQAALAAAKALGLTTGGWIPKGCRTEHGRQHWLRDDYGLQELPTLSYALRTWKNVHESDATLWVGRTTSPGFHTTQAAVVNYDKPFLTNPTLPDLRAWIADHHVTTLNVAGNRSSTNPGIYRRTFDLLYKALTPQPSQTSATDPKK